MIITEYRVNALDEWDDIQDVEFHTTLRAARKAARAYARVSIERTRSVYASDGELLDIEYQEVT